MSAGIHVGTAAGDIVPAEIPIRLTLRISSTIIRFKEQRYAGAIVFIAAFADTAVTFVVIVRVIALRPRIALSVFKIPCNLDIIASRRSGVGLCRCKEHPTGHEHDDCQKQ